MTRALPADPVRSVFYLVVGFDVFREFSYVIGFGLHVRIGRNVNALLRQLQFAMAAAVRNTCPTYRVGELPDIEVVGIVRDEQEAKARHRRGGRRGEGEAEQSQSGRQRRRKAEMCNAETCRAETRRERESEAQREREREKPAEFRAMNVEKTRAGTRLEARSYIGSAPHTLKCAW